MKTITLKFGGSIYMEYFGEQEEEDRIKVFDSDKEYLDCFSSVESLEETRSMYRSLSIQDLLDVYADQMAEKESVEALLDYLGVEWRAIYPNKAALIKATNRDAHEIDSDERINHIGRYYVEVAEYQGGVI